MTQLEQVAVRRKLPLPVLMFAVVSLLNEVSAQMVAPLIPILLASVLAAGPVAIGAVEGIADAVAAFLKLWSGRHADVRPAPGHDAGLDPLVRGHSRAAAGGL